MTALERVHDAGLLEHCADHQVARRLLQSNGHPVDRIHRVLPDRILFVNEDGDRRAAYVTTSRAQLAILVEDGWPSE